MSDQAFSDWFEALWADREDRAYRSLFEDLGVGVFTAGEKLYERYRKDAHPGRQNHGVFACPPHEERDSWIYVTSGFGNPWNLDKAGKDPSGFAGLGCELVVDSTKESDWAVPLLHNLLAYELLVAVGNYEGAELFEYGNRILHLVEATDPEVDVARNQDQDKLVAMLQEKGFYPLTNADRQSTC